ncbi:MAG: DUF2214 family protein [Myxococcota bacterium]
MSSAIASALHLLSLALGLPGVFIRGLGLRDPTVASNRRLLLQADNVWGVAAMLWIGTGLWRLLGGVEKATAWYLGNPLFHLKATLFGVIFLLELWPMVTFIRWRVDEARGRPLDFSRVRLFRWINHVEVAVVVGMVFVAAAMARGVGYRPGGEGPCAVQQVMITRCSSCHAGPTAQAQLELVAGFPTSLVNRRSAQWPEDTLVVPGNAEASLLYRKLSGTQGPARGAVMPLGGTLSPDEVELVGKWIGAGAGACTK